MLCGNEFQVQGVRLVLLVLEAAGGGGRSDGKGFGFVVGLPAHDQRPDDPHQMDSLDPHIFPYPSVRAARVTAGKN